MAIELHNPPGLPTPTGYTHLAVATGSRLVFVAGQVAEDAEGRVVGAGDFAAQAREAFANVGRCLAAAGARPEQVARLGIYVVGYRPELLPAVAAGRIAVFGDHRPTDTLLGVAALADPGHLIEVDAVAVVD